uniref:Uncharacterized protein n=1 Tax=viral metagenome TaxID=1070528 RepID=A0A6M3KGR7_9ZZZZ
MSTPQKMPPPRTIWMRYTSNDGKTHVMEHQVWDKDRFLSSKADDAAKERARAKDGQAKAEQITEDQYRSER